MKKGTRKPDSKWGEILDRAAAMRVGSRFLFPGDRREANRLRAMLHVSSRTYLCRFTVKQVEEFFVVEKVGGRRVRTTSEHGTWSRYAKGCRCGECRRAGADYLVEARARNRNSLR